MYANKISKPFEGRKDHFIDDVEGVARVRKGMFAFFMEESPMFKAMEDTFYEHEKCEIVNVEYMKFTLPYLAIQKNSPLKEIFKVK